jgi:pilin isopeptide linkage protein
MRVLKEVVGNVPASEASRDFGFTITYGGISEHFTLKDGEHKDFIIPGGTEYEVVEADAGSLGYAGTILNGKGTANGQIIIVRQTNTYMGREMVTIAGEKTWDLTADPSATLPASIQVILKSGGRIIETATVTPDLTGKWLYTFSAPKYEPDGVTLIPYTVEEILIPSYGATVSGYNILNTYIPPVLVDPPVSKVLTGDTPSTPAQFTFRFTGQGGAPMPPGSTNGVKVVNILGTGAVDFGDITYTVPGVYHYTISEVNTGAAGYTYDTTIYNMDVTVTLVSGRLDAVREISKQLPGGLQLPVGVAEFINQYDATKNPELITIHGAKTWNHGANPQRLRPQSSVVVVKNGNVEVAERLVTAADGWAWTFSLPKYNAQGDQIAYTISERQIPSYTGTVYGYDITNTFTPSGGTDYPGGSTPPMTGDVTSVVFFMELLMVSLLVMLLALRRLIKETRRHTRRQSH